MEQYWFPSTLVIVIATIIIFSFFRSNSRKQNHVGPSQLGTPLSRPPPGTVGWPFIGETLDYISKLRNGNLREFIIQRTKRYGSKVFTTSIIGHHITFMCGAEGNKLLFSNENKLVNGWFPSTIERIFTKTHGKSIGSDFEHVRKIITTYMRPSTLQKYVGTTDNIMKQELEEQWKPNKPAIVRDLTGRYALRVACQILLGLSDPSIIEKLEKPEKDIAAGIISFPINFPGTTFSRALKSAKTLIVMLGDVIRLRKIDLATGKVSRMQDMLSELLYATDENGKLFEEKDIAHHLMGLTHGGYDLIRCVLTFIVKYLAEFPQVYDQVFREHMELKRSKEENEPLNWEDLKKMKYSWNVVQEIFRLTPPVLGTFREVIKDFTFEGYTLPKGYKIHWTTYCTHKDSKYFPNPEKFDPSRFSGHVPPPFSYVPFGGGPRMCPVIEYAKMVILVFMHNIVTRYKWELMIPDEKVVVDPHPRPTRGLPVHLHPHIA